MQLGLSTLYKFLDAATSGNLVLATVVTTTGASYRKPGAMMLIDEQLNSSGLVSGGCLEDDLKAHAQAVFESGEANTVHYDLSEEESASLWGLGLGCGGEIIVLLELINEQNGFGGLSQIRTHWEKGQSCGLIKIIQHLDHRLVGRYEVTIPGQTIDPDFGIGRFEMSHTAINAATENAQSIAIPVSPANRLLVCGAGPDAIPLVALAAQLNWRVTVVDPRPAYLTKKHFPEAEHLVCKTPDALDDANIAHVQAAVIMTHNVERDARFLTLLHSKPILYIGLLGPAARRSALLKKAGIPSDKRVHGPAGIDIGSILPEEIALSILAEIHAVIAARDGGFLSNRSGSKSQTYP